jgi:hypothetical protein
MARECGPPSWVLRAPTNKSVIARFMRATQFLAWKRKMGCPDKPGNDDFLLDLGRRHLGGPHSRAMTNKGRLGRAAPLRSSITIIGLRHCSMAAWVTSARRA